MNYVNTQDYRNPNFSDLSLTRSNKTTQRDLNNNKTQNLKKTN